MKPLPAWHYDEFKHIGVDYADPQLATAYDAQHTRFRGDLTADADFLLDALGVQPHQSLIDIGCGTGHVAIQAAKHGLIVYAVDVSPAMLACARKNAEAVTAASVSFHQGGFLTYEHQGDPVDFILSTAALHHLPDFWKLVGLQRIAGMLKDDGLFYLMDTVYSFAPEEYARFMAAKVSWFTTQVDEKFGQEVAMAFRDEFSTCDWIMEGLLTRAGFRIDRAEYQDGMLARYWCRKRSKE